MYKSNDSPAPELSAATSLKYLEEERLNLIRRSWSRRFYYLKPDDNHQIVGHGSLSQEQYLRVMLRPLWIMSLLRHK